MPHPVSGLLILDKPIGWSSMRAVAYVRRRAGGVRTGHAGTLDPLATGVLVLALGAATRRIERLMATRKRYRTTVDLSAFTTTDDREGERTEVAVASPPSRVQVDAAVESFVGTIMQRPPIYSAMKVGGRRSYKLARKGDAVELAPRPVDVFAIRVVRFAHPQLELDIECGKGTYIRSLARDLGVRLGTGGHCESLRRTAVGPFDESMARAVDALPAIVGQDDLIGMERIDALLG